MREHTPSIDMSRAWVEKSKGASMPVTEYTSDQDCCGRFVKMRTSCTNFMPALPDYFFYLDKVELDLGFDRPVAIAKLGAKNNS